MSSLNTECPICQKEIKSDSKVVTPCDHTFCTQCFFEWIMEGKNCPLCIYNFISSSQTDTEELLSDLMAEVNIEQVGLQSLKEAIQEAIFEKTRARRELGLLKREQERLKAVIARRRIQLTNLRNKINYRLQWIKLYSTRMNLERQKREGQKNQKNGKMRFNQ